jgi:uncharacterized protein YlxW (UPF0749 family)
MKKLRGLIAATFVTAIVGLGMVGIGANALSNPNSVAASNSPAQAAQASQVSTTAASDQSAQIQQLQNLIKQYQSREQQYQTEIKSLSQKVADGSAEVTQAQQVLQALQERGIIQITRDGRIFLRGGN